MSSDIAIARPGLFPDFSYLFCFRERVQSIYKFPQITEEENISVLLAKHMQDYRRFYIEHPRIRLDGVYIAVCHYMYETVSCNIFHLGHGLTIRCSSRDGISENAWVNVSSSFCAV